MKKGVFFVLMVSFLLITSIVISACSSSSGRSANEAAAIKAAWNSVTREQSRRARGLESEWKAGPLKGGIGVLSQHSWAYWYKDGVVYAANGLAMSASPNLPVIQRQPNAPTGIGHAEIEAVVR